MRALNHTLARMDQIRARVDQLAIPTAEAIGYYTGLNGQNLALIDEMAKVSPDPVIYSHMVGYSNFLQAKERAGIERAVGAGGLSQGQFSHQALTKFKALIAAQDTYNNVFLTQSTARQKSLFNSV